MVPVQRMLLSAQSNCESAKSKLHLTRAERHMTAMKLVQSHHDEEKGVKWDEGLEQHNKELALARKILQEALSDHDARIKTLSARDRESQTLAENQRALRAQLIELEDSLGAALKERAQLQATLREVTLQFEAADSERVKRRAEHASLNAQMQVEISHDGKVVKRKQAEINGLQARVTALERSRGSSGVDGRFRLFQ